MITRMKTLQEGHDWQGFPMKTENKIHPGLTKREYFAGLAMQGLLTYVKDSFITREIVASDAVQMADALIKELNKDRT